MTRRTAAVMHALQLASMALLLAVTTVVPAADEAGRVHRLIGRATAAAPAGDIRSLEAGAGVFSGDLITTGPNSYLRIGYTDGSFMMLRPNTRFQIREYRYTREPEQQRGFFALLKGGLRAVTGAIGKFRRKDYSLRTAVATIGIRGTDYETRVCAGDCQDVDPPPADGLYVGLVRNEGVVVTNAAGELALTEAGSYLFTPGPSSPPRLVSRRFASPLTVDKIPAPDPQQCF